MQLAFQIGAYLVGLSLQLAILVVLLRGQWKRYAFLFLYVIADFLTTVSEIEPSLGHSTGTLAERQAFAKLYWLNERILQVLIFLLVVSLVYRATERLQPRRTLLLIVIAGTLLFAGISLLLRFDPHVLPGRSPGRWMMPWTGDLNFFAALLDLGLWAVLIGARKKDYKLLMISGGLGIQFTAGAIGWALRQMTLSPMWSTILGAGITLANMGCLYIWWQALLLPVTVSATASRPASNNT